jgi:hypothetical protein
MKLLYVIAVIALWVLLHRAKNLFKGKVVCRNCGSVARSAVKSPRSLFIEILLWFCGLIPGVLYTLWCNHETHEVCEKCGSRDIIPVDSPVGRQLAASMPVDVMPMSEGRG